MCPVLMLFCLENEQYLEKVSMIIKAIFGIATSSLHVYTAQLYPAEIRTTAYGFLSFFSRLGGIIMSYMVVELMKLSNYQIIYYLLCSILPFTLIS